MVWTEATDLATGRPTFPAIEGDTAIFGYTADELRRGWDHVPRLVHPEDRARVDANNASAQRSPEGLWEDEYRIVRRDGSLGWVHGRARRVTPFGESPAVWHGITIDVTARHAGEHPGADPEIAGTDRV
jgi:PAS domain S-box-containing protein